MRSFSDLNKKKAPDKDERKIDKKEQKIKRKARQEQAANLAADLKKLETYFTDLINRFSLPFISEQYEIYKQSQNKQEALLHRCLDFHRSIIEPFQQYFDVYQNLKKNLKQILPTDTVNSIESLINRQINNPHQMSIQSLKDLFLENQRIISKRNQITTDPIPPVVAIPAFTVFSILTAGLLLPMEISYLKALIKKSRLKHQITEIDKLLGIRDSHFVRESDYQTLIKSYIKAEIAAKLVYNLADYDTLLGYPIIKEAALTCITFQQANRLSNLPKLPQDVLDVIASYVFPSAAITGNVESKRSIFVHKIKDKNLMLSARRNSVFHHDAANLSNVNNTPPLSEAEENPAKGNHSKLSC